MPQSVRFGFLPEFQTYHTSSITVEPINGAGQTVRNIVDQLAVKNRWLYPPLVEVRKDPAKPARRKIQASQYRLPATHEIRSVSGDDLSDEFFDLLVAVLGFLKGVRLNREGWTHFYRTPSRVGLLHDFHSGRSDTEKVLDGAERFWKAHQGTNAPKWMFGALHWFLFCESYEHPFEVFAGKYRVLDTCWRLFAETSGNAPAGHTPHGKRVSVLCNYYGVPEPSWVADGRLVQLRNDLEHEALFAGEPIGFKAVPNDHDAIHRQLGQLTARLILGILGIPTPYVRTSAEGRDLIGLDVP